MEIGAQKDTVVSRAEVLTIDGDIDNDSDGTQTGFLPIAEARGIGKPKRHKAQKPSRKLQSYDFNSQMLESLIVFL